MSYSIQCVHCKAVLKSPTPVPAGKKVKCPKCKEVFTTPAAAEKSTTTLEKKTALGQLPPEKAAAPPKPTAPVAEEFPPPLAKLEAEHSVKPASPEEAAAALAKLEADQAAGAKKPVPQPMPAAKPIPNMEIPDEDEDLVEPEEEELEEPIDEEVAVEEEEVEVQPEEDEDDEPRSRRQSRQDEEDEDDKPRSRRKSRRDEDEEEEEEEEEDDEPRSRRKSRGEDDEEEDDEPRSRRKSRHDEDDEEDDDEPRARSKKKKKAAGSGALLWIFLLGGGFVSLFTCCGCGVGGWFLFFDKPNIVGAWQTEQMLARQRLEFFKDGTGKIDEPTVTRHFTYTLSSGSPPILERKITREEFKGGFIQVRLEGRTLRDDVRLEGDQLTLTQRDAFPFGIMQRYRRIN